MAESDGDTFWAVRQGKREKIRIHGIDAPEMDQSYGEAAKKFAASLVFGKVVTVKWKIRGKYGRIIGTVALPVGRDFGLEMVRAGLAWWFREYAENRKDLADAEAGARSAKRSL